MPDNTQKIETLLDLLSKQLEKMESDLDHLKMTTQDIAVIKEQINYINREIVELKTNLKSNDDKTDSIASFKAKVVGVLIVLSTLFAGFTTSCSDEIGAAASSFWEAGAVSLDVDKDQSTDL